MMIRLGWTVLVRCLRGAAIALGALWVIGVLSTHVELLPTFLSSRYEDFWDDVIAYRLIGDRHKPLDELYQAYGTKLVREHALEEGFVTAFLPSEKAAFAAWVTFNVEEVDGTPRKKSDWLLQTTVVVLLFYVPAALFLRSLANNLTWWLCRSERSVRLFAGHFAVPWYRRALGSLLTFPAVAALALGNASGVLSPELQQAGVTLIEEAILFTFLAYLSGLGPRVVTFAIDGAMIARGVDPQRTYWDEAAAAALTAPALLFVYRNSFLSVFADVVAGLAPLMIAKALHRLSARRGPGLEPSPDLAAAGSGRLAGSVGLAALGAFFCFFSAWLWLDEGTSEDAPTRMSLEAIEAHGAPARKSWLELTDGYLFWPKLVPSFKEVQEADEQPRVDRYYVPLVSKGVLDEWRAAYGRGGDDPGYPFERGRVVVVFHAKEFRRRFPLVVPGKVAPDESFVPYLARGLLDKFPRAKAETILELSRGTRGFDSGRLLFLQDGREHEVRSPAIQCLFVGLVCLLPLVARLLLGWPPPVQKGTSLPRQKV
jgi:hypothetical protein